jgi:methylmalonyl-CoA mutase cobalamin-binding subunit
MSSQPRTVAGGRTIEYAPSYKQLTAISHGKPVVAVTIADADYHTAPDLVRLAMAEAGANDASYLSWPTWPEGERKRMEEMIRPQAEFMRKHAELFSGTRQRRDVVMFLPFHRWVETADCLPLRVAASLSRANIQYEVICEDQIESAAALDSAKVFVADLKDLTEPEKVIAKRFQSHGGRIVAPGVDDAFLKKVRDGVGESSVAIRGPSTIRAVVRDQRKRTLVHVLNLNVQKLSSFQDKVTPAENVGVEVWVPFRKVRSVKWLSADEPEAAAPEFQSQTNGKGTTVRLTIPKVEIAGIVVVE